jgi:erythronate-4-phosphate dehydrogenase
VLEIILRGCVVKIVADQNMPRVREMFSAYGELHLLSGREISAADVIDADILLVRSVTIVGRALLEGSSVKFVGSATIGTDHIDLNYLETAGIGFGHAPGCNAESVVQYDLSVMCRLMPDWKGKKIGIVGCGNVGGRLYKRLQALQVSCTVYDPFLSQHQIPDLGCLDNVLECEVICVHTPITVDGEFPTQHLINAQILAKLKPGTVLINAGRGAVVDNKALLASLKADSGLQVALDVWEWEPLLDINLMNLVALATPHIAGHSFEGKTQGTHMVFDRFCQWANISVAAEMVADEDMILRLEVDSLEEAILDCYDVSLDDQRLREAMRGLDEGSQSIAAAFDRLRKDYPVRREFGSYTVDYATDNLAQYQSLGFNLG